MKLNQRTSRTGKNEPGLGEVNATKEQYLAFEVSEVELTVPLANVSEVVPYEGCSPLPSTPDYIRGLLVLRERMVPVVDLALRLGRRPAPAGKRTCIMMLDTTYQTQQFHVGIVVDGIATLLDIGQDELRPVPPLGNSIQTKFLKGVVMSGRGTLPVLDVFRLFNEDEVPQLAEIASMRPPRETASGAPVMDTAAEL